jgi:hypothetical protein
MTKNTDVSSSGYRALRQRVGKTVIAACIVSLAGIAPAASGQTAPPTASGTSGAGAAPAAAGAAGTAGAAGLSIGTLAAIGAGVVTVAAVATSANSSSGSNGGSNNGGTPGNSGTTSAATGSGTGTTAGSGQSTSQLSTITITTSTSTLQSPGAGTGITAGTANATGAASAAVNTGLSTGTIPATGSGVAAVSSGTTGGNIPIANTAAGTIIAQQTGPSNRAQFEALLSAGALKPNNKGGFDLSPSISHGDLATLISLSWNAIQAAGINQSQLIDVLATEPTFDGLTPTFNPNAGMNLAQLESQLTKGLNANGNANGSLDEWSQQYIAEVNQYLQNTIANDVQNQKLADLASQQQQQQTNGFPYIASGMLTPVNSYPTNLTATYNGVMSGALTDATPVNGTLTMTVNFSNLSIIPGTVTFANGQGSANFGLTASGGFIGGQMAGTYAGEALNTDSTVSGQFYGPNANEVGGTWTLGTATKFGNGQFAAKR